MATRHLVVDLAARSKNWALTAEGEQVIRDATPTGWDVHIVRALTSSDGDGPREPSAESMQAVAEAEAYFGFGIPRPLFHAARRLRWVHSAAAGVGNALFAEMLESPVVLTNSAGIHAIPIAEYVVAGLLHFFRGLDVAVDQQRRSAWDKHFFVADDSPVREITGASVVIVGTGGIGRETAVRLRALGARCTGVRRRPDAGTPAGFDRVVGMAAIEDVLPGANAVVLAAPLTPETTGLLSETRLALLGPGAVVVNVARGALVDEVALARMLGEGRLRGAALDVFREEPLASESPLWQLRNVLLTPHISPVSPGRFWPRALELFCDNWRRYARGDALRNRVDKTAGY